MQESWTLIFSCLLLQRRDTVAWLPREEPGGHRGWPSSSSSSSSSLEAIGEGDKCNAMDNGQGPGLQEPSAEVGTRPLLAFCPGICWSHYRVGVEGCSSSGRVSSSPPGHCPAGGGEEGFGARERGWCAVCGLLCVASSEDLPWHTVCV
jgi:hypothetical protein